MCWGWAACTRVRGPLPQPSTFAWGAARTGMGDGVDRAAVPCLPRAQTCPRADLPSRNCACSSPQRFVCVESVHAAARSMARARTGTYAPPPPPPALERTKRDAPSTSTQRKSGQEERTSQPKKQPSLACPRAHATHPSMPSARHFHAWARMRPLCAPLPAEGVHSAVRRHRLGFPVPFFGGGARVCWFSAPH